MADVFANFVYCSLTASITNTDTVLPVNSTSRIPDPATGEVWLTLDSTLTAGNFEIVRVTAKTATSITVQRSQEGTTAPATTASGTTLRGALTAGMLNRLRPAGSSSLAERLVPGTNVDASSWTASGNAYTSNGVGYCTTTTSQSGALASVATFALVDNLRLRAQIQGGGGQGGQNTADEWQFGLADAAQAAGSFIMNPNGIWLRAITYQTYRWDVVARTGGVNGASPNGYPALYDATIYQAMLLELVFNRDARPGSWRVTVVRDQRDQFTYRLPYTEPASMRAFINSRTGGVAGTVTITTPSVLS